MDPKATDPIESCSVDELAAALASGAQALDVREPAEFASEHIRGTTLVPLSRLESSATRLERTRPTYLVCRSGQRADQAAQRLGRLGFRDLRVVRGGLLAWTAAGHPVARGERRVWSLDRQVRFTAGALVLTGLVLALAFHPAFAGLSLAIGGGLVFSAVTDTCAMGTLLARMPWNQRSLDG